MRVLTGDRPSGKLHIGHYFGSLQNRVFYQDKCEQFIIMADLQTLTDNFKQPEILKKNILEVVCDYLSVGIDPKKSTIFIQSMIPAIPELTIFFMNLVTVSRLQRNPTVKTELKQKNMEKSVSAGFLTYPVSQAADILIFEATHVPVGEDQIPLIEQTNEIARTFNNIYGVEHFSHVEAVVPKNCRLVGIDGNAKMSKSLGNAIYLSDDEDTVVKKVNSMFTDPAHIKVSDPGKIEGNVVFEYLDIFDENKKELEELKDRYKNGGLGDVILKKRLAALMNNFLDPIRTKRKPYENNLDQVAKIIIDGTEKARTFTDENLKKIKKIMKISYF